MHDEHELVKTERLLEKLLFDGEPIRLVWKNLFDDHWKFYSKED